jgi:dipeptidyl aminopeptidase/acylaminoacyl peptidase
MRPPYLTPRRWWPALLPAVLLLGMLQRLPAQGPPSTDIWLVALTRPADGSAVALVGAPRNLTARPGYDNQPSFTADGRDLLYTGSLAGGQTDICRVTLATGERACHRTDPESEYSPQPAPGGGYSVVRVEADSTQRLWRFPAGGGPPQLLLPALKPVGYYAWVGEHHVVAFVLGAPPTFQAADLRTGDARVVAQDVGRSIQRIPGTRSVSFPARDGLEWRLERYDVDTGTRTVLTPAVAGAVDHVWVDGRLVLMAGGNRLYGWTGDDWTLLHAFTEPGLQQITRLAVSPDGRWLALVGASPAP